MHGGVNEATIRSILQQKEAAGEIPNYDITRRNGYPIKCIKCGQDTLQFSFSVFGEYRFSFGLGQSVCPNYCSIR